jgi:hypothetical protein
MIIDVLGLGESIKNYNPSGNITIGVNDIFKYHKVDHLLVMDKPERFERERLKTIMLSTPKKFYSNCREENGTYTWQNLVNNFIPITPEKGRGNVKTLDSDRYSISSNSTFTAVVLAYKLGAKQINCYGLDFNTHPHLSSDRSLETIIEHFTKLRDELSKRYITVFVSSQNSKLASVFPVLVD